jgi:hypothetical protein
MRTSGECGRNQKWSQRKFDCDDLGDMTEYNSMKLTEPVLMQIFEDEFDLLNAKSYITPGEPGKTLYSGKHEELVDATRQTKFRSGVGKLLHLMKCS